MMRSSLTLKRGTAVQIGLFVLALLAATPLLVSDNYYLHVLTMAFIFVILAASLDLLVGVAGLLSLGHTAFFGIGAYVSALATIHLGTGFWIDLPLAGASAALLALLLGLAILNVRGHRFVISTIAISELGRLVAYNWTSVTGGQIGLSLPKTAPISTPFGPLSFASPTVMYYLIGAIALASTLVIYRIALSTVGLGMKGLRENDNLAEAVGVDTRSMATIAFVVSAFFAGVAGALYAHFMSFVSPDLFYFSYMTTMLVMVILGGKGTIIGPAYGALIFTIVPESLRVASEYRLIIFGALLALLAVAFPGGLAQLFQDAASKRGRGAELVDQR
jgi:branched-chain amino acid transport system permease protein